jgi:Tfp pilus assembly protein PilF
MYYFFTDAGKQKYILTIAGMGIATAIFLIIRRSVLGDTESLIPIEDNSLVAIKNILVQRANAVYIFGHYLLLMIYPMNLIVEGSYNHFKEVTLTSWKFLLPFVILVGGGVYALLRFKKKDIVSFSILYFLVTASLVSNVVILIGTNYGERLMFIPSLGICLLFAVLLSRLFKIATIENPILDIQTFLAKYSKPLIVVMVVVLLFGVRTMARNMDWKDDFTLYQTDLKKVPDSAHLLFYVANHLTSEEYLPTLPDSASRESARNTALKYLSNALEIFPKYADAYQRRGFIYNQMKNPDLAEKDYREALVCNPTHPIVYNNYGTLCFDQRRFDEAKFYFQQAVKYNPSYAHALNNLASTFGVFGMGEAEMATKDPSNKATHEKLARENFETAISYFKKSIIADPQFAEPYRLASVTFRNLGDQAQGDKYDKMYKEVSAKKNAKD